MPDQAMSKPQITNAQADLFDPMGCDIGELLAHVDDLASEFRWQRSLADLFDVLVDDYRQRGMDDKAAFAETMRIITLISHYWGGRQQYVPQDEALRIALRDAIIWQQFTRRHQRLSVDELGLRHNLTVQQVYSIIKQQKKLTISRLQTPLFD